MSHVKEIQESEVLFYIIYSVSRFYYLVGITTPYLIVYHVVILSTSDRTLKISSRLKSQQ